MTFNLDDLGKKPDESLSKDKEPKKESNTIGFIILIVVMLLAVINGHQQRQQQDLTLPSVASEKELQQQANKQFCEETEREKAIEGGYYDKDADYGDNCF